MSDTLKRIHDLLVFCQPILDRPTSRFVVAAVNEADGAGIRVDSSNGTHIAPSLKATAANLLYSVRPDAIDREAYPRLTKR
jgi:hypothetical protein